MRDWFVSQQPQLPPQPQEPLSPAPQPWRIAMAGGEVVMPGTRKDWRDIVDAVRAGRLTREQLEINASGVYRAARRLAGE